MQRRGGEPYRRRPLPPKPVKYASSPAGVMMPTLPDDVVCAIGFAVKGQGYWSRVIRGRHGK